MDNVTDETKKKKHPAGRESTQRPVKERTTENKQCETDFHVFQKKSFVPGHRRREAETIEAAKKANEDFSYSYKGKGGGGGGSSGENSEEHPN